MSNETCQICSAASKLTLSKSLTNTAIILGRRKPRPTSSTAFTPWLVPVLHVGLFILGVGQFLEYSIPYVCSNNTRKEKATSNAIYCLYTLVDAVLHVGLFSLGVGHFLEYSIPCVQRSKQCHFNFQRRLR